MSDRREPSERGPMTLPDLPPLAFEATGEHRTPKRGEWFVSRNGSIAYQAETSGWSNNSYDHRTILRVVDIPARESAARVAALDEAARVVRERKFDATPMTSQLATWNDAIERAATAIEALKGAGK